MKFSHLVTFSILLACLAWHAAAQSNFAAPFTITTLAGVAKAQGSIDGPSSTARFSAPCGVAVDLIGNVYVADLFSNTIRKITPAGLVSTLAGQADSAGSADGLGAAARFDWPVAITVDAGGNLFVADYRNHLIRKITPAGLVSTLAGTAGSSGSSDGAGSLARFDAPDGVAVDASGNLYVADSGNHTIRKISPAGVVTTLAGAAGVSGSADGTGAAARFSSPYGIAVDGSGNIYVGDGENNLVRKITPGGAVSTLAGATTPGSADGTGSAARFKEPSGLAVDANGDVFVADYGNHTLRRISPAGVVTTLAGTAGNSGSSDGTGSAARFSDPRGVAVDRAGVLYVADSTNHTIRRGALGSGPTISTQPTNQRAIVGASATFTVAANGNGLTYQWRLNGNPIAGATAVSYSIARVTAANAGSYTAVVTGADGSIISSSALLTVDGPPIAYLSNLSVLARAGTASETLTVGVIIGGGSGTKPILIRGIGPSLEAFGVTGALADPTLTLSVAQGTLLSSNDDWGNDPGIIAASAAVGAFALPAASKDAVINAGGFPAGGYVIELAGKAGATGAGLIEIYDTNGSAVVNATSPRLVNVAARTFGGTGSNTLIVGFTVAGTGSLRVLVRASGPALAPFGLTGLMPDPKLELFTGAGTKVTENDNWDPSTLATQTNAGAFPFPAGSKDAVVIASLAPGGYTAQVTAVGGATGVALIEVYELP